MDRIRLCGVGIDNITLEGAVRYALSFSEEPCVVFTPNAVMLDACKRNREVRALFSHASLALADGMGVVWAARRAGMPLRERVAGIEFGEALLSRAAEEGLRVFLLGGGDGVANAAARALCKKYPGLCVCGTHWGYFDAWENGEVLARIRQSRTDILFVCLGFPLQERWICENLSHLSSLRVIAGLGGSLDVWAGRVKRAPRAVSHAGLEWAWRMARDPRRIGNLLPLIRFGLGMKGSKNAGVDP